MTRKEIVEGCPLVAARGVAACVAMAVRKDAFTQVKHDIPEEVRAIIRKEWKKGTPAIDIARKVGRRQETVSAYMWRNGMERPRRLNPVSGRILALLRESGAPLRTSDIAASLRTSRSLVYDRLYVLLAKGLVTRIPGERTPREQSRWALAEARHEP